MSLSITLISDIICPWCYVGKKRLESAIIDLHLDGKIKLDIAPYQLYPDTPDEGRSLKSFGKKGHKNTLTVAGAQVGIAFRWDLIQSVPNTLFMHQRLMALPTADLRWQAKDALLEAYFCNGIDLTQEELVSEILSRYDLKDDSISAEKETNNLFQEAKRRDIAAVPSFILDSEHHITGAMEKQQWAQFLKRRYQLN